MGVALGRVDHIFALNSPRQTGCGLTGHVHYPHPPPPTLSVAEATIECKLGGNPLYRRVLSIFFVLFSRLCVRKCYKD